MKVLKRAQFGNPVLRKTASQLSRKEIESKEIQELITNMRHTLVSQKLGVGLAAPQVGKSIVLAVIAIRPTELRPKAKPYDLNLINPKIIETKGTKKSLWEGCISCGSKGKADLFAKVPRYSQIRVQFTDEEGKSRVKNFSGLKAQIIQHEIDHLNGVLFVDHVEDTSTYMTYSEYLKRVKKK